MNEIRVKVWNEETKTMSESMTIYQLLRIEHDNGNAEGSLGMEQYGIDTEEENYGHLKFLLCSESKDKNEQDYKELYDVLAELVDLIEDHLEGKYDIDSFTLQPAQVFLKK